MVCQLPPLDEALLDQTLTILSSCRNGTRYGVLADPQPGFTEPNGVVNVTDVQAFVLTLQGPQSPSVHTTWVDLRGLGLGSPPDLILNVSDLQRILFRIDGLSYTETPEQLALADCP